MIAIVLILLEAYVVLTQPFDHASNIRKRGNDDNPTIKQCTNSLAYIVQQGDYCYRIAMAHGTTVSAIQSLNPEVGNCESIYPKQLLCLPKKQCTNSALYVVQQGDYCFKIATDHGTTVSAIQSLNPEVGNCESIYPNQLLCLPIKQCTNSALYVVQQGDYCYRIAMAHGTTVSAIQSLNPEVGNCESIYPNQLLCLPKKQCINSAVYVVQQGDKCNKIATDHGTTVAVIQKLNPEVGSCKLISPNQVLCLPAKE
jgi:LysM repeat protein